jgi:hypothetical protein
MTIPPPSSPPMTDVLGRFPDPLPRINETSGPHLSNPKRALLGTAAVLLGGGATFAAINFDQLRALMDEQNEAGNLPELRVATQPMRQYTTSAVQHGTSTPSDTIAIAGLVEEQMTFGQAYATARQETGPGGIFSWHGQMYNTYTLEEWRGLSLVQRQEFLSDVGYRPAPSTGWSDGVPPGRVPLESTLHREDAVIGGSEDREPAFIELVIQGRPALGIDDDDDGIANAIVFMDENSNDLLALVDAGGEGRIDTAIRFDPFSQQIVGQQVVEAPFVAEIARLEAMSWGYRPPDDVATVAGKEDFFEEDDNDYTDEEGYVNDAELPEMD